MTRSARPGQQVRRRPDVGAGAALLRAWADELAAWRIPESITSRVDDSPWVLPTEVFSRRAERQAADPSGPSYESALEALGSGGSVLDVGAGGGAAILPLAGVATGLTAVDANPSMLSDLAARAAVMGLDIDLVEGTWPEVAERVPVADVVVCHHVLYNVPDLGEFVSALSAHARRRVVVEITARHPLTSLNRYWRHFHGLDRPDGPTADLAISALRALGYELGVRRWWRAATAEYGGFDQFVEVTRRRLCLPRDRAPELAAFLRSEGVPEDRPPDLGSSGRDLVTLWWPGVG